jgi:hypothetical protein
VVDGGVVKEGEAEREREEWRENKREGARVCSEGATGQAPSRQAQSSHK